MGTCYYFARPDNRTLFDMEKAYGLAEILHAKAREPIVLDDLLAAMLLWYGPDDGDKAELVTDRILQWAQGKPVYFINEHDEWIDGDMFRENSWLRIYGTRFGDEPFPVRYAGRPKVEL